MKRYNDVASDSVKHIVDFFHRIDGGLARIVVVRNFLANDRGLKFC